MKIENESNMKGTYVVTTKHHDVAFCVVLISKDFLFQAMRVLHKADKLICTELEVALWHILG